MGAVRSGGSSAVVLPESQRPEAPAASLRASPGEAVGAAREAAEQATGAPDSAPRERSGPIWFLVVERPADGALSGLLGAWLVVTAVALVLSWLLFGRW